MSVITMITYTIYSKVKTNQNDIFFSFMGKIDFDNPLALEKQLENPLLEANTFLYSFIQFRGT